MQETKQAPLRLASRRFTPFIWLFSKVADLQFAPRGKGERVRVNQQRDDINQQQKQAHASLEDSSLHIKDRETGTGLAHQHTQRRRRPDETWTRVVIYPREVTITKTSHQNEPLLSLSTIKGLTENTTKIYVPSP